MEIIKDLPKTFEEFAEARRNAFVGVKNVKDAGTPVIGSYCTYFPSEIAMAAGCATVGLCSTSGETIPDAEKQLPANLCPLIKSSFGFAATDKCPFFYFSDLVIGETTCDGKKKMYEIMQDFKDVYVMNLPNSQDEISRDAWRKEMLRLKAYIEKKFEITITDDDLRKAIKLENEIRLAKKRMQDVMKNEPCPVAGLDLFKVLYGSGFKFDRTVIPGEMDAVTNKIMEEYKAGNSLEHRPRIVLTGCPIGGVTEKVIKAIEDNGGVVVAMENCTGAKQYDRLVDEETQDPWTALSDRYLNIGCSVMAPNDNRYDLLGRTIDEFKADGVVEMTLQACHTYNVETFKIGNVVTKEKGIPYLAVETDYSTSDEGQLNTRIAAFIEML